ncbi:response regulator [bacterium]|nr:response regulator [bacterium]RQV95061.1 MAG: response regulator [bacterium]
MPSTKTLLFVDDEEEILDILVDLFSREGYNLYTATKATDAMEIIDNHSIDFVLSDLKLPDASGSELLERIRIMNPNVVCVLTSGYFNMKFGSVMENEEDGTLYLAKPWDLITLKQLVSERLGN